MREWIRALFPGKQGAGDQDQPDSVGWKKRGDVLLEAGDLVQAEDCYRQALAIDPGYALAYSTRGFVLKELGRFDEAERSLRRAVDIEPALIEARYFLSELAQLRNQPAEAAALLRSVLQLDAGFEFAYRDLWRLYSASGEAENAKLILLDGIAHCPHNAEFHFWLGNLYFEEGEAELAIASYRAALAIAPAYAVAQVNLSVVLQSQGRVGEASIALDAALHIDSHNADWQLKRGYVAQLQGELEAARRFYLQAIELDAGFSLAHANLGNVLEHLDRHEEALASHLAALRLEPNNPERHFSVAVLLQAQGKLDEAVRRYRDCLALDPPSFKALSNMAVVLATQGRHDEALACYDTLIGHHPTLAQAHVNKAYLLLNLGRYPEGWREYEYRWQCSEAPALPDFSRPLWLGEENLSRKAILLVGEQGFGDMIHFMRYTRLVADRGARVYLQVPAALKSLAASCPGVVAVFTPQEALPSFDYFCPLMSLPLACGTTLSTIPNSIPYLTVAGEKVAHWRESIGTRAPSTRLRVGLAWAGDARLSQPMAAMMNQQRSMHFSRLLPLLEVPGVEFFSLQVGETARSQLEGNAQVRDLASHLRDFEDTAALIENLDLVISVDTSVVHLSGAIGKRVWMLDRLGHCYRWLPGRDDSPWYPTLRIFRQTAVGDWDGVVERARQALLRLLEGQ